MSSTPATAGHGEKQKNHSKEKKKENDQRKYRTEVYNHQFPYFIKMSKDQYIFTVCVLRLGIRLANKFQPMKLSYGDEM